ncbi:hypothetical protein SEUCBS139899_003615 [Sporothrix eucalyptigena]|uniref:Rhodopsin domain-containing protein n=1 Tax=Sporothrix eucalyptigena TaxID=1812306 RepID=A0ABP0C8I9_9PEZI
MADGSRGPQLAAILISFLVLSIISTILRCYSMGIILKRFYIEDWLAVITICFYCAYTAVGLLSVHYGVGQHVVDVPPEDRVHAVMWRWIGSLLYIMISTATKYVVGLFLLRICSHCQWQRITIWVLLAIVTVFNVMYLFFDIFSCRPIEYQWTRYADPAPEGTCNATSFATVTTYVAAFLNVVADWVLAVLPSYLVWQAKMERRKKISVSAVLALGSVASIATIVRIPYADGYLNTPDFLYNFTDLAIWSTLEIGIALTASSLATLTPLFRKIKFFSSSSRAGESGTRGTRPSYVRTGGQTQTGGRGGSAGNGGQVANLENGGFDSELELQPMERLSSGSDSRLKGAWRLDQA